MSDLISRGRARHEFEKFFADNESIQNDCDNLLCMLPEVDAAPVVHGLWEDAYKGRFANCKYICSVCRKTAHSDDWQWLLSPYCPNCGAKMDGERRYNTND